MQHSKLAIRKGNHLSIEGTQKGYLFCHKMYIIIKDFPRRGGRYAVALSVISETACCLVSKKKKVHCGRKPHRWFTVIYSADKN